MQANRVQSGQSYSSRHVDPNDLKPQNDKGDISLHLLVKYQDLEGLKGRIRNSGRTGDDLRAFVNCQNHEGDTPLHYAADISDMDICTELMNNGASPNLKNRNGRTPHSLTSNVHLLNRFIRYGGNVDPNRINQLMMAGINARKAAEAKKAEAQQRWQQQNYAD